MITIRIQNPLRAFLLFLLSLSLLAPNTQIIRAAGAGNNPNPPPAAITSDLSNVSFTSDIAADVGSWPASINLSVVVTQDTVNYSYDKMDLFTPVGGDGSVGNGWLFWYNNGWQGTTVNQFRPNHGNDNKSIVDEILCGGISGSPTFGGDFVPVDGQQYGFMVSGQARAGATPATASDEQRSNVVMATWNSTSNVGNCTQGSSSTTPTAPINVPLAPPTSGVPAIDNLSTTTITSGNQLSIYGTDLTGTVLFYDTNGARYTYTGSVNSSQTITTVTIPVALSPAAYVVKIYKSDTAISNGKDLNIQLAAQTAPVVCNPPSTDPQQLYECNYEGITYPSGSPLPAGVDPTNPVTTSLTGVYGISGAYDTATGQVLIVSGEHQVTDGTVWGMLVDAQTLQITKQPFRIDQSPVFAGSPQAVYDPDQNRFFVAWQDGRNSKINQSYGRFVAGDGTPTGSEIQLSPENAMLNDLDYNPNNKTFVSLLEAGGNNEIIKVMDAQGQVQPDLIAPRQLGAAYEGQGHLAVNTNLNQYWQTVASCTDLDTSQEDCKEVLNKIDITTNTLVGDPIILSQPHLGHNSFAGINIAYSPQDRAALIIWQERFKNGQVGRTAYDNGSLTDEYDVLTPQTYPYSDQYGGADLNFNPWTDTIFDSTEDDNGGTILIEMLSSGLILHIHEAIAPPGVSANSIWEKLAALFVPQAEAAFGTFNPANITTPYGALTLGSQGYETLIFTETDSALASSAAAISPAPSPVTPPAPPDTSTLPKLINLIYIWALGIGSLLAVLMTVIGGFYYMTAHGNAEQSSKGTDIIWGAVIGLALLFGSYLILRTINPDLVNFNLNSLNNLTNQMPK